MVALGYLIQATLGASPVVDGLACTPTSPRKPDRPGRAGVAS